MDVNYFVCTLGEAVEGHSRPFRDINNLIDAQANDFPDLPAVGFFTIDQIDDRDEYRPELLSFKQLRQRTLQTANLLWAEHHLRPGNIVGLLCSTSVQFLFIWLACVRLGCPVLLIAPECSVSDTVNLCEQCDVSVLFVDCKHEERGTQAADRARKPVARVEPLVDKLPAAPTESCNYQDVPRVQVQGSDIAYFHHSSGTSTGVPKLIPQTHHGVVGTLPAFEGRGHATFTTTPLYHGGPADLFRAWTSHALTWMFPSNHLPVTATNVMKCIDRIDQLVGLEHLPRVKYFTSVPYVLESMATDVNGVETLRSMELVGVGGATLPEDIGDDLAKRGIHLVSRYGTAECGFLMSSHREYSTNKDWAYLRSPESSLPLIFEAREDGLSELIVPSEWPNLAKRNRDDGSYATGDLFAMHPTVRNAWKYHSPAGARLTLSTGKKFDPTSIEANVRRSQLVEDALVFGTAKPYPGVLVFPAHDAVDGTDEEMIQSVVPKLDSLDSESHAQIPPDMVIPMPFSDTPVTKSSKGTILRNRNETRYKDQIEEAYKTFDKMDLQPTDGEDLSDSIRRIIQHVLRSEHPFDNQTDLVSFGVDSIAAIRIRKGLCRLLRADADPLPMNVVEDCGSVDAITRYISKLMDGKDPNTEDDDRGYMLQLVDQYSNFLDNPGHDGRANSVNPSRKVVVLTGATGALGATVLSCLSTDQSISKIYCLVRAENDRVAYERVEKTIRERQLSAGDRFETGSVEVFASNLSDSKLGLDKQTYARIAGEATVIMHVAWSVNFRKKLRSFASDDLAGLQNMINLALASDHPGCATFAYCSSTASVADYPADLIPERIIDHTPSADSIGYAKSKWVAEQICRKANTHTRLQGKVSVFRVGQLTSHTETGIWNYNEAWPLMLSTAKSLHCLPSLPYEPLNWLPLDVAAASFIDGACSRSETEDMRVFHLVQYNTGATWNDLVEWLAKKIMLEIVPATTWLQRLEAAARDGSQHPAIRLVGHWKVSLSNPDQEVQSSTFEVKDTRKAIPAFRDIEAFGEPRFEKLWNWIEKST